MYPQGHTDIQQFLRSTLRSQREQIGLTLEDLASAARISIQALADFEGGQRGVATSELERVCDILALDPLALRHGEIKHRPTAALFFRQGSFPDFRDDADRPKIADAFERAVALVEVSRLLRRPPSLRASFAAAEPSPPFIEDGYRLARSVRKALNIRTNALPDMTTLLEERFDIIVRSEALSSAHIDAVAIKEPQTGAAAVVLNINSGRRHNPLTARVDLAHELGHILFDPANAEINLVVDYDKAAEKTATRSEQRANAFAAELLLPLENLRRVVGTPNYEMSLAQACKLAELVRLEFVAPIEITVNHLVNHEYIVATQREATIAAMRAAGDVTPEPEESPGLRFDVLDRRVMEALTRELISEQRARELLQLTPWDDLPRIGSDVED